MGGRRGSFHLVFWGLLPVARKAGGLFYCQPSRSLDFFPVCCLSGKIMCRKLAQYWKGGYLCTIN